MPKRTFKPSALKHVKQHGYRARTSTKKGKVVLKRRILKGRHTLTA